MATYTVTNLNDSGPGSLRQAMIDAAATPDADTIDFTVSGTIALTSQLPVVMGTLTIEGPGVDRLTVSGSNQYRIFEVQRPGNLTIQGVTLADGNAAGASSAGGLGGAIFNKGTVNLFASVIQDCTASASGWGNGGAINNQPPGRLTVRNSTLRRNEADVAGAIISWESADIADSVLNQNSAQLGGAVLNEGTMTIRGSTLTENTASGSGGAVAIGGGEVTIERSALVANQADSGGALDNSTRARLVNVTLSGNRATTHGGAISSGGTVDGSFVTIADSEVATAAGAAVETGGGSVRLLNSIVANTTDGAGKPLPNCSGVVTNAGGSISTDGSCTGFQPVTPAQLNLGPLALNPPGTTPTYALLPGSVAIDAAVSCSDLAGQPVTTDQRGAPRPQGPACDVGAYEASYTPPPPPRRPQFPPGYVPPDCGRPLCPPHRPG